MQLPLDAEGFRIPIDFYLSRLTSRIFEIMTAVSRNNFVQGRNKEDVKSTVNYIRDSLLMYSPYEVIVAITPLIENKESLLQNAIFTEYEQIEDHIFLLENQSYDITCSDEINFHQEFLTKLNSFESEADKTRDFKISEIISLY